MKSGANEPQNLGDRRASLTSEYGKDAPSGPGPGSNRKEFGRDASKKIPFPGVRHTGTKDDEKGSGKGPKKAGGPKPRDADHGQRVRPDARERSSKDDRSRRSS